MERPSMSDQISTPMARRLAVSPAARASRTARTWRKAGRPWLVGGLLLLLAAAAGVVWWSTRSAPAMHYVTVPVMEGAIERAVTATSTVNPKLTIIVGSYVSGVIQMAT
jgi:multidrug efflux pump subunit AcrA (membrane-fusion protein)